jgi:5-methyltetrahydrofolate--homocysteine methyltransferase
MATVKGDVHDIGKNIVAVVLQCNNYEIIDLGVMVSSHTILDTAIKENVDIIGLSGLITPSLDEMVSVAEEMKRRNMTIPVMIGGATTSKKHTAVKISPDSDLPVVYVTDASRAVQTVENLMKHEDDFMDSIHTEYESIRNNFHNNLHKPKYISLSKARENKFIIDENYLPPKPLKTGVHIVDSISLDDLIDYIDWTPFFHAWELHGTYPKILNDEKVGEQAQILFNEGNTLLDEIVSNKTISIHGVYGIFPANSIDETITIYTDENRDETLEELVHIRQQMDKGKNGNNYCLADFVTSLEQKANDWMGAFAVMVGPEVKSLYEKYEADHNDYAAIMLKVLADRLAEAFAEKLHYEIRKNIWGYEPHESLTNDELIKEKYIGIRPAPGYAACPDHTEKEKLFELLNVEKNIGLKLTENYAMDPVSAVSGWYFSHPKSTYFSTGKIKHDQIELISKAKNWDKQITEKWLATILEYK